MSEVVKPSGYRGLSHIVQTTDGEYYLVDSVHLKHIFETMVFDWTEGDGEDMGEVACWGDRYCERYRSYDEMRHGHFIICEHLEDFIGK